MRTPHRAAGIVINNGSILLMHRIKKGNEYWVFPGGGVEEGEDPEETVRRELMEETTIDVHVDRLLYQHHYHGGPSPDGTHYFYLCTYRSGEPKLGESEEKQEMEQGLDYYDPCWVDTGEIGTLLLYPLEIRDWLIHDLAAGFPEKPREASLRIDELRQSL